jgi:uncharacterized membrane protein YcaP (DUF421 family)
MLIMRLMGKREVGQLQPFDLVIAIIIAELASIPMANAGLPITYGIAPIVTLLFLHNLLAFLMSKSDKIRALFSGKAEFIIRKGVLDKRVMREIDYNLNDLLEQLRSKNVINIADIQYAILETNGQLSIFLYPEKAPLTPADISQSPVNEGFHYAVIMDGKLKQKNMEQSKINMDLLIAAVKNMGFECVKNVFIATVDENGHIFAQSNSGKQNSTHIKGNENG